MYFNTSQMGLFSKQMDGKILWHFPFKREKQNLTHRFFRTRHNSIVFRLKLVLHGNSFRIICSRNSNVRNLRLKTTWAPPSFSLEEFLFERTIKLYMLQLYYGMLPYLLRSDGVTQPSIYMYCTQYSTALYSTIVHTRKGQDFSVPGTHRRRNRHMRRQRSSLLYGGRTWMPH